jgi:cytochrome P450
MRPSIQAKVDELIDAMLKQGAPLDLSEEFSLPLSFKVIYKILGIPFEVCGCVGIFGLD